VYAFPAEIDAWWRQHVAGAVPDVPTSPVSVAAEPSGPEGPDLPFAPRATRVQPFLPPEARVDPESAPGHAGLAVYFFTLTVMGLLDPTEGVPAARAAANRALHLDKDNAEAHAMLGVISAVHDLDWAAATGRFDRALRDSPVPPTVRFHYASWFLAPLQRYDEALAQVRTALVHEPLYLLGRTHIGTDLCGRGEMARGLAELEDVIRIDPMFGPAVGFLGRVALAGHLAAADALSARAYASIPQHPNAVGFRAGMLQHAGNRAAAEQVIENLARNQRWALPRALAEAHLVHGECDAALDRVADGLAVRDPGIWILFGGSAGTLLRERPGWPALRSALRLPP
jgi:Tfp pilus assembly protein PilF